MEIVPRVFDWRKWPELAPEWERLHRMCPDASVFLSREWVDCWLATFGEALAPEIVVFSRAGEAIGCCLLVWRTVRVRGIPMRRVYLNCAGEDDADSTCIEYNGLLSVPEHADAVAAALLEHLRGCRWDELLLYGIPPDTAIGRAAASLGTGDGAAKPSHNVDLAAIRAAGGNYDASLSSNTRQQIRRSLRLYEQAGGSCTIHVARSAGEGLQILDRLAGLHQAAWHDRGRPGVFASARFTAFHRRLIAVLFERNAIFLAEVRSGDEVIAALYSPVARGKVYFYQSGFHYSEDARLKPGLVAHYLAIRHCLESTDLMEYDFLAGDSQYKRSLGTGSRALEWLVIRRRTPGVLLYRGLRWMKQKYVESVKKSGVETQQERGDRRPADVSVSH
jgi:CelD/BcsL family acetyltransferase involved in cellulose biosynthesis